MRKIALVNQKGGVGKTTTAIHLSTALSILGQRVLLIDLDPQSNATLGLGLRPKTPEETIYAVLTGDKKPSEVILPLRSNLDVIPASIDLAGAEMELSGMVGRELVLRDAMKELAGYDFVIIDSPPSMGILNVNGLTAASEVFIPIQCEFFALQGISLLMKTIQLIQKRLNPELKLTGVIPCMVDVRKGLTREVLAEIETYLPRRFSRPVSATMCGWPRRPATGNPYSITPPNPTAPPTTWPSPARFSDFRMRYPPRRRPPRPIPPFRSWSPTRFNPPPPQSAESKIISGETILHVIAAV